MQISTCNYLNIPESHFGLRGIQTGDAIYQALDSEKIKIQYNALKKHIVVLDSSDLSSTVLESIIYQKEETYDELFPKIKKNRDADGNILIKFSCFHPYKLHNPGNLPHEVCKYPYCMPLYPQDLRLDPRVTNHVEMATINLDFFKLFD